MKEIFPPFRAGERKILKRKICVKKTFS